MTYKIINNQRLHELAEPKKILLSLLFSDYWTEINGWISKRLYLFKKSYKN